MTTFKASNGYLVDYGHDDVAVEFVRTDTGHEAIRNVSWDTLRALVEFAGTVGLTATGGRGFTPDPPKPINTDHIRDMASDLTDRSLDGRGDERGRCPATLFAQRDHARCSEDRGHDGRHHSIRLAAHWSRDEPMVATLTPAGPEWEEFKAWKANKESQRRFDATKAALLTVAVSADERGDMDNTAGVGVAIWKAMKLHEAGTIDLSIYDEGKSE